MDWLENTRDSYDTVAVSYAELVRPALANDPYLRAALTLFTELLPERGPVTDVGCGPGHVTAHLNAAGVDAFGIDLSPGMVEQARRDHPALRFETGSMTDLRLPAASQAGLVAFWSLIHVPDAVIPSVLAQFHRVLRADGVLMVGFHVGDRVTLKTEGYGGHPMRVHVHVRPTERMVGWLQAAGFSVEAQLLLDTTGAILVGKKVPQAG